MSTYIGQPTPRIDGRAKVTGRAKYAAEYAVPGLTYGVVITSPIARGQITRINAAAALAVSGVLGVITHENAPRLARSDRKWNDEVAPPGSPFRWLQDAEIHFSAQPVAVVVAETFEQARYAATLVHIACERKEHATNFGALLAGKFEPRPRDGIPAPPPPRGDPAGAFERAVYRHDGEYHAPAEHHNPMEMFATTVVRQDDGTLTVYDKTQGAQNVHHYLCNVFGIEEDQLRVLSPYVGGTFGLGLRPQYTAPLAVMAAHMFERSVRVSLTRQQMFGLGFRPMTWQRVALGAGREGQLEALIHHAVSATSRREEYTDPIVQFTGGLYRCPHVELKHNIVPMDVNTPVDMRAPGAAWGIYALECAMDELAVAARIDPLELRLKNYSERDQIEDKPYTSKALRECYQRGAERFGWSRRNLRPGSMREGNQLIGWGMATGRWEAMQAPASAKAVLKVDGTLIVSSATADIGTGTYTIMTQIAAETLGLPLERVTFKLGDSTLPHAPVEGGSFTAASVGTAVKAACERLREKLVRTATEGSGSPLAGLERKELGFEDGRISSPRDKAALSLTELMQSIGLESIEEEATTEPAPELENYARYTHSAVFVEVKVDADFGTTQVTRVVSAIAGGRILNPMTARSQIVGGIVWGIGMALQEASVIDQNFGRFMTRNLADYHIPVNADVHDIDVIFVDERDDIINPLGVKGLGEPGLVGVAPAIANAVFHATGKRIRTLPITPELLL
jgi:xanthine dehydrogenase YagR molybdenum-binding subunit